ncbi:hypothetical protein [Staphylococcus succinus]|uniref:hypothetical protein n=2 Tax=Staphylococcus succinus TaxID=61015 RepID=UPI00062BC0F7|nr:hypothetical protein [Staphylococcus succinus]MDH9162088.1 hypothetical protein [Staphylococcus succinus]PNZ17363.1 hypothetical protein CD109_10910 [Staphylococcus succinus subsp. succinus]RIN43290.1 hypothetical protein BU059_06340 [Staphylococcus succinus]
MKLEEFQRLGQTVKTFTSKLHENPGKFVAIVTQMYWDMKSERDTLIDDLKVLRAKNEKLKNRAENAMELAERSNCGVLKLERENEKLHKLKDVAEKALKGANYIIKNQKATIKRLEQENAQLKQKNERLQKAHSDGWKEKDKVIKKLNYLYTTLTDHIRLKASANPGEHRYIALVNFIDRLEKGEK